MTARPRKVHHGQCVRCGRRGTYGGVRSILVKLDHGGALCADGVRCANTVARQRAPWGRWKRLQA